MFPTCRISLALLSFLALSLALAAGCEDDTTRPQPELQPETPESLVNAIATVYNDTVRTAQQRLALYQDLFPPATSELDFVFWVQEMDVQSGLPRSWGLTEEIDAHRNIFQAQERGDIFSINVSIQHEPPEPLEFPDPGQEDWRQVQAINVNLRLLVTPVEGFEVVGGQARFLMAPADNRWYICEWRDLPRPMPSPAGAVQPTTWGSIKASFR
jgi:hypothetical protein